MFLIDRALSATLLRVANNPQNEQSQPHRLRRLGTVWTSRGHPIFFVTLCTAERQRWLDRPEIHRAFLDFCAQSPKRASAWTGKYVLMPDHIHVFVSAEGSQGLSRWVGALKRNLAAVRRGLVDPAHKADSPPGVQPRPTTDLVGRPCAGGGIFSGRAWQAGFFDHVLRSSESYGEKWEYVRMNPVRAGLAARPEDWPYAGEIEALRW